MVSPQPFLVQRATLSDCLAVAVMKSLQGNGKEKETTSVSTGMSLGVFIDFYEEI